MHQPVLHQPEPASWVEHRRSDWLLLAGAASVLMLVIARTMVFPMQRDEDFYVAAGVLFSANLYDATGYSHLPNLPLLLSAAYRLLGTTSYLLVGRIILALGWIAAAGALWRIGRDVAASRSATVMLMAGLLLNPAFLDQTGMAVTNNFLPVPLILWGLWALLRIGEGQPRPLLALAAGLLMGTAAGMKANYAVVVAPALIGALAMPRGWTIRERLILLALPLAAGALIGVAPTLWFLARDPQGFLVHAISFHRGPQLGYWTHLAVGEMPAMGAKAKALLANRIWFGGTTLVLVAVLIAAALSVPPRRLAEPRILVVALTAVVAALISWLPTPAFPQYFTLPIPFLLVLLALLVAAVPARARAAVAMSCLAGCAATALAGAPPLLLGVLPAMRLGGWTGVAVHDDALRLTGLVGSGGRVATLGPVVALEGRLIPFRDFAMGPFVYRALDFVPGDDRGHYAAAASPATLAAVFPRMRPDAVITGFDPALDPAFDRLARGFGYRAVTIPLRQVDHVTRLTVYLRPERAPATR